MSEYLTPDMYKARYTKVWFNGRPVASSTTKVQLHKPNRPYIGTIWLIERDKDGKPVKDDGVLSVTERRGIIWYTTRLPDETR